MALFIHAQWVGCNVGVCTWLYVTGARYLDYKEDNY